MTATFSDPQIIEAFRVGGQVRERAWEFAYKDWRDRVIGVVVKHGGSPDDALSALHEVAPVFERTVARPGFALQHRLSSYFVACVLHRWMRDQKMAPPAFAPEQAAEERHLGEVAESVETQIVRSELARALDESLGRIGARCRDMLRLFMNGFSMREIAERMAFSGGEQVARNEKAKCQNRYEEYLREHPVILNHIKNLRSHG